MDKNNLTIGLSAPQSNHDALPDLVYRAILDAIFRGQLRAGDIVSEVHFARALGVSRTPVHAAVRDLIRDGLLMQDAGRRPAVSCITRDDLREIFEMRRLLEGEATYRAAETMGRQTMQRLELEAAELDRQLDSADILKSWSTFDDAFHEAIALSCNHKRLAVDILRYRRIHFALNSIRMQRDLVPQALGEHRSILRALRERDADAARREMQQHLREWQAYYINLFPLQK